MICNSCVFLIAVFAVSLKSAAFTQQLELVQVVVVNRHGDRAPLRGGLPLYPVDWLAATSTQPSQLTPLGTLQAYQFGQWLQQQYVTASHLLSPSYVPSEVYVRSTQFDRTIATANAILDGLFSNHTRTDDTHNGTTAKIYVPVNSVPVGNDVLFRGFNLCSEPLAARLAALEASDKWKNKELESREFLEWYQNVTGFTSIDMRSFYDYYDPAFVMFNHNLLPSHIAARISDAVALASWVELTRFQASGVLSAGLLLGDIAIRLADATTKHAVNSTYPKLVQYSGHDVTISTLGVALGIDSLPVLQQIPAYASALLFELWAAPGDVQTQHARVIVYFRDGVAGDVTLVMNRTLGDLQTYCLTHAFGTASEWCDACGNASAPWDPNTSPDSCVRGMFSTTPSPTPTPIPSPSQSVSVSPSPPFASTSDNHHESYLTMSVAFGVWGALSTAALLFVSVRLYHNQKQGAFRDMSYRRDESGVVGGGVQNANRSDALLKSTN